MIKKYLIQIEENERTKWLCDGNQIAECLRAQSQIIVDVLTTGTRPSVTVVQEEIAGAVKP